MDTPTASIILAIIGFTIIAVLLVVVCRRKEQAKLTPLAGLAFGFMLMGLFFGDERWLGYSLLGIGFVLAVADIIRGLKEKHPGGQHQTS